MELVVIGGFAAAARGVPHVTDDVDICYAADQENRKRLVAALAPLHPRPSAAGLTDSIAMRLPFQWDALTLERSPMLSLQTDAGRIDLLDQVKGIGPYAMVRAAASQLQLGDEQVLVLDLAALVISKQAAGRAKDLLLVPQIEATLRLYDLDRARRELDQQLPTRQHDS